MHSNPRKCLSVASKEKKKKKDNHQSSDFFILHWTDTACQFQTPIILSNLSHFGDSHPSQHVTRHELHSNTPTPSPTAVRRQRESRKPLFFFFLPPPSLIQSAENKCWKFMYLQCLLLKWCSPAGELPLGSPAGTRRSCAPGAKSRRLERCGPRGLFITRTS